MPVVGVDAEREGDLAFLDEILATYDRAEESGDHAVELVVWDRDQLKALDIEDMPRFEIGEELEWRLISWLRSERLRVCRERNV